MTDREALAAALASTEDDTRDDWDLIPIIAAARERLAQLPEKCGTCGGDGIDHSTVFPGNCQSCHGSGKVYPAELVERIARAIHPWEWSDLSPENQALVIPSAVAVLDALNETP